MSSDGRCGMRNSRWKERGDWQPAEDLSFACLAPRPTSCWCGSEIFEEDLFWRQNITDTIFPSVKWRSSASLGWMWRDRATWQPVLGRTLTLYKSWIIANVIAGARFVCFIHLSESALQLGAGMATERCSTRSVLSTSFRVVHIFLLGWHVCSGIASLRRKLDFHRHQR